MIRRIERTPNLRLLLLVVALHLVSLVIAGCGPKLFPKCGEPGVNCPPCSGLESYPDPCAGGARDAGTDR